MTHRFAPNPVPRPRTGARARLCALGALAAALCALMIPTAAPAADVSAKIINGNAVTAGNYTARWGFIVGLISSASDPFNGQFCGGALIEPAVVLTAAHCISDSDDGSLVAASSVDVLSGTRQLSSGGERINVTAIERHPSYNNNTLANDIALLFLENDAAATPISLPTPAQDGLWGDGAGLAAHPDDGPWVGGWGNTDAGGNSYPDIMREVVVPLMSDAACNGGIGAPAGFTASNMICGSILGDGTSATTGRDTCQGDSGGPLTVSDGAGGWLLVGATSWGYGCASDTYGVYTRLPAFRGWISTEIDDHGGGSTGEGCGGGCDPDDTSGGGGGGGGISEPGNPTSLRVSGRSATSLNISWNPPNSGGTPSGYKLYRSVGNSIRQIQSGSSRSATVRNLAPNTSYWFYVSAYNSAGESFGTSWTQMRTAQDRVRPRPVSRTKILNRGRTSAKVGWRRTSDNHGIRAYEVWVKPRGSRRWKRAKRVGGRVTRTSIRRLKRGKPYQVRVTAVDYSGNRSRVRSAPGFKTRR